MVQNTAWGKGTWYKIQSEGKKHGTKYIQSPLAGPWGGPNPTDEGIRERTTGMIPGFFSLHGQVPRGGMY